MKNNISFNSNLSKFGIGLFETIKIENEPKDFDSHMDRLYNSVKDLNIKINKRSEDKIAKEIYNVISEFGDSRIIEIHCLL